MDDWVNDGGSMQVLMLYQVRSRTTMSLNANILNLDKHYYNNGSTNCNGKPSISRIFSKALELQNTKYEYNLRKII